MREGERKREEPKRKGRREERMKGERREREGDREGGR